jgi:cytochrome c oxidase subunit 1
MSGTEVEPSGDGHEGPDHITDEHTGHGDDEHEPHIHMPSPSYWPLFTSIGLPILCYGMIYKTWVVAILGGVWLFSGMYAWALEPATAPEDLPVHGPDTAGHDVEAVPAS